VPPPSTDQSDPKLLQAVVRAHVWLRDLKAGKYDSIEDLAKAARLHPKVVRQKFKLAFLSPGIMIKILEDQSQVSLRRIRLSLNWRDQMWR
jgi:hypothetical protein